LVVILESRAHDACVGMLRLVRNLEAVLMIGDKTNQRISRGLLAVIGVLLLAPAIVQAQDKPPEKKKPAQAPASQPAQKAPSPPVTKQRQPVAANPTPAGRANVGNPPNGRASVSTQTNGAGVGNGAGGRNAPSKAAPGGITGRSSATSTASGGVTGRGATPSKASGGITGRGATTPTASGGITGRNTTTPGGITGRNTTTPGGITGRNTTTPGGITGRNTTTPGGITGRNAATPTASGGITGRSATTSNGGSAGGNGNRGVATNIAPVYRPAPGVKTTARADGGQTHVHPGGMTINTDRGGHVTSFERPGIKANNFRADGHAAHIENARADGSRVVVDRGLRGDRRVEVVRPGGMRVVTMGRTGFVERPIRKGFVARTYVVGGRSEVRVYREQMYGRVHYYTYVPRVYYQPAFYAWAYRPWGAPVAFAWGFGPSPWYGYYGGYFAPEPVYPSAALWLTDFLLAENLRVAYENQLAANGGAQPEQPPADNSSAALSPEIKRQIAEEVQQQLAAERDAAAQPPAATAQPTSADAPPPALDPKTKIFVVTSAIDISAGDQTCALTPGDIIERTSRTVTDDGRVPVSVLNSKNGDCPVDFAATMDVGTLQDMHNQLREQIAAGMDKLASSQGKGLPSGPAANPRDVADGQAPASADAKDLLTKQASEADKTEAQVKLPPPEGQP
jgi:hypothetical protein